MKPHTQFDISDFAAQQNPGWRVRWGSEGSNAVLLVNNEPKTKALCWRLYKGAPEDIILGEDGTYSVRDNRVEMSEITFPNKAAILEGPKLLKTSYQLHIGGLPAPRHKQQDKPYISASEMQALEEKFFNELVAPYISTHRVYTVSESGTRLANRIGVTDYDEIFVTHYTSDTVQDESIIHVNGFPVYEPTEPVLVIDDMVSSGHTAAAILKAFEKEGIQKVRYVTLFNIIASRENHDVDSAIESLKPLSNFYWIYGRGMDLMDEESRRYLNVYGADKCYEHEMKEDVDGLLDFFNL